MKHRHKREKNKLIIVPPMISIIATGAKNESFTVCRCGAIHHLGKWVEDPVKIHELTQLDKSEISKIISFRQWDDNERSTQGYVNGL